MALRTRAAMLGLTHRHRHHAAHARQPPGRRPAPAWWCSPTRPSSAPTPSPTRPASTRTACSSTRRPTRSCGRETVGATRRSLVLGKHSGRHAFAVRLRELGYALEGEGAGRGVCALQGAGRQEEASSPTPTWRRWWPTRSTSARESSARRAAGDAAAPAACPPPPSSCAAADGQRPRAGRRRHRSGATPASRRSTRSSRRRRDAASSTRVHAVTEGIDALGEVSVRLRADSQATGRVNPQHGTPAAGVPRPRRRHRHHRRQRQGVPGGALNRGSTSSSQRGRLAR